jgi:CHAT domain-containing protein/Tfp pilus assembly protein PilF
VRANQDATNAMAPGAPLARQAELREKALGIWKELGETAREADTLLQLGIVRAGLGQAEQASPLLHRAADLYRELDDPAGQAKALNEAGLLCERSGHTEEAQGEFRQALDLARLSGSRAAQVNALTNVSRLLNRKARQQEAIALLEEAQGLATGLTCQGCLAGVLIGLGSAYEELSDTRQATAFYKQALAVTDLQAADRGGAFNNLGLVAFSLGDFEDALDDFRKAYTSNGQAPILSNQGITLESLGRLDEAMASYTQAIALARQRTDLRTEIEALHNLVLLHLRRGEREAALAAWKQMEALAGDRQELASIALVTRAAVRRAMKDPEGARSDLESSLRLAHERGSRVWEAIAAQRLAQVEHELGLLPEALGHVRAAMAIIESQRSQILSPDLRALFLGTRQPLYELTIAVLMDLHRCEPAAGWDRQALQINERARARSLLDLLAEIRTDLRKGVDPKLLAREAQARAEINARELRRVELIHRSAEAAEIGRADGDLQEALSAFEEVEAELRRQSPAYSALTQPQPLDAAGIQSQVLGEGTLLLEYSLGEEKSYLWAVGRTGVRSFELPGREAIEGAALATYARLTDARSDPAAVDRAALALSRMILGPAEGMLSAGGTLLVVSDGVLQYIPFAALPVPSSPRERLLARLRVVSLPSASTLAVLRQELRGRAPAPRTLAVFADPVFREDDPRIARVRRPRPVLASARRGLPPRGAGGHSEDRIDLLELEELPWSAEEAKAISGMVPDPGQKLVALGFDASVDKVLGSRLSDYRYVHFATHGILNNAHPERSSLVFSGYDRRGKKVGKSVLPLQDIYNLQLHADLVVLSACETALGKEIRGEGLMGLTRGFMYAGSARVLASLWSVEDRATSKLMKSFYRQLLVRKLPPAEALRQAQLELAGRPGWSHPYYWAGFSLQGEWQ